MADQRNLTVTRSWQDRFIPARFHSIGDDIFRSRLYVTLFAFSSLLHLLFILGFFYGLDKYLLLDSLVFGLSLLDWIQLEMVTLALYYAIVALVFRSGVNFNLSVHLLLLGIYLPIVFGMFIRLSIFNDLSYGILPLVVVAYNLGGKAAGLRWTIFSILLQACFMWFYFTDIRLMAFDSPPLQGGVFGELIEVFFVWSVIIASSLSYENDIESLKQRLGLDRQRLQYQADHDPLTQLPNSKYFKDSFHQLVDRHNHFALIYIDLDNFKQVNDSYGHTVGDKVLWEVAERLRQSVRSGDVCGRLGGDEFAVLLVGLIQPDDVEARIARIKDQLTQVVRFDEVIYLPRASVGYALYPTDSDDYEELINCADLSMYQAKQLRQPA